MKKAKLMLGDNIESLKKLPENSIDSIVTDGPYGLTFMNKKWDYDVPSIQFWQEVYRVLKPGGHVLSFGGTRTYHRMVVNMEDAGFEIRDQIMWLYGSGFPKSCNVSKQIDKKYGRIGYDLSEIKTKLKELYKSSGKTMAKIDDECGFKASGYLRIEHRDDDGWGEALPTLERWNKIKEIISYNSSDMDEIFIEAERDVVGSKSSGLFNGGEGNSVGGTIVSEVDLTKSKTPEGAQWEGWGTALKPANEPICLARKPLSEKSIAENVLKWGTGGINIDGCRINYLNDKDKEGAKWGSDENSGSYFTNLKSRGLKNNLTNNEGRFPANIILDEIAAEMLDEQSGYLKGDSPNRKPRKGGHRKEYVGIDNNEVKNVVIQPKVFDSGGASRFFYQAKVSKAERNMGLDGFEETTTNVKGHGLDRVCMNCGVSMLKPHDCKCDEPDWRVKPKKNTHPTVKPVALMTYLCRLITPPNGIVLDPFMGSGSTGISALLEGFRFCGMEMDPDYFKIAEARISSYEEYRKFIKK